MLGDVGEIAGPERHSAASSPPPPRATQPANQSSSLACASHGPPPQQLVSGVHLHACMLTYIDRRLCTYLFRVSISAPSCSVRTSPPQLPALA